MAVIMRRYENRSTITTSNRPMADWGKLLFDMPTAGAILDSFLHHAISIPITGKSYHIQAGLPPQAPDPAPQKPANASSPPISSPAPDDFP